MILQFFFFQSLSLSLYACYKCLISLMLGSIFLSSLNLLVYMQVIYQDVFLLKFVVDRVRYEIDSYIYCEISSDHLIQLKVYHE
jgi:hypothetical protein